MRKLSFFLMIGLIMTAGVFTSCEKVADELQNSVEVTINTDFQAELTAVPSGAKSVDASFNESIVLDPKQNADLADYLASIKSVTLTDNVKLMVTSVSSPDIILETATITITDNVTNDVFTFTTPANMPVIVGTSFPISANTPGYANLAKILQSMHAATITATGSVNKDQFTLVFNFLFPVKVVANP